MLSQMGQHFFCSPKVFFPAPKISQTPHSWQLDNPLFSGVKLSHQESIWVVITPFNL
jgi:hypothetical protein